LRLAWIAAFAAMTRRGERVGQTGPSQLCD
jgi:hypothetical protein